jgi:hypothetical protein
MKKIVFLSLLIMPLSGLAQTERQGLIKIVTSSEVSLLKNTVVQQFSNLEQVSNGSFTFERTVDFPTQVVRIHGDFKDSQRKCPEIDADIKTFFTGKIDHDRFYYNILTHCHFDPKTEYAVGFSIDAYFDPMTDDAIEYLKIYLSEHNGRDFLGTIFAVESATGLVVSLNIDAGVPQDEYATVLLRYQHDNKTLYFPNNYEMLKHFITDLYKNFYTNESQYVLPFLNRWFYPYSGTVYNRVLRLSSYVLLQPERIFMMSKAPLAYTSPLRMYFAHKCEKYPNKKCL